MANWGRRIALRGLRGHSFWIAPTLAIAAALAVGPVMRSIEEATRWRLFGFTPDGARTVLGAFTSSMLTFIIFVVTSVLLIVQLASAQLTPRIIALTFERGRAQRVVTFFTFAFTYTVAVSSRIGESVPQLPVAFVIILNLASISLFFRFAYALAVDIRPVSVLTSVARLGRRAIDELYPADFDPERPERVRARTTLSGPTKVIRYSGSAGSLRAFHITGLVAIAEDAGAVVELVPQVGDFVTSGDPLFRVTTGAAEIDAKSLLNRVDVGPERTIEQDPRFAFRIIVDIANKGLSPAINDPTTAVLAVDQVHRLLLTVGSRHLDESEAFGPDGKLRLVYGTPDWDDYVSLGLSEIRLYGAGSIQIARRLLAMLDHLLQALPGPRHGPLLRERLLLKRSVERAFPDQEDRANASIGDCQGMGGSDLAESLPPVEARTPAAG